MSTASKPNGAASNEQVPEFTYKLSGIAQSALDQATEKVGKAEGSIRESVSASSDAISDNAEIAGLKMETAVNKTRYMIAKRPLVAAGVAFAAGFLLTSLTSDKKS
ncbi:MAG: hypothetical protein R3F50_09130 [Gammaproteobacteria bacterium]|jgi:ElaB/YqjD/DUF883 family membrane-anchored ribosome-binding protein